MYSTKAPAGTLSEAGTDWLSSSALDFDSMIMFLKFDLIYAVKNVIWNHEDNI